MQPIRYLIAFTFLMLIATSASIASVTSFPGHSISGNNEQIRLNIRGTTDTWVMAPLIKDFQSLNPKVSIRYEELTSAVLHQTYLKEIKTGERPPDLLISSAMDLQTKLVNDGHARAHRPENAPWLPDWAGWQNRAFGFTAEPAVIVYNPALLAPEEVPRTRFELLDTLRGNDSRLRGRIITYDVATSGVGYLFATQDSRQSGTFGRLIEALGRSEVQLDCCTVPMIEAIADGEFLIGYNLLGSYARALIEDGLAVEIVLPEDYTLVLSRVALIPKAAGAPGLAGEFINYLLSQRGQQRLSDLGGIYAIHPEVTGKGTFTALQNKATGPLQPIRIGPGLLVYLDAMKRERFLEEWRNSMQR